MMPTQAIRRVDGKGRHTTTWRALVPIPGGGAVIDTPGVRAVGLLDGVAGLDRAFADIAGLAQGCRYADCGHDGEPACAVRDALTYRGAARAAVGELAAAAGGGGPREPAAGGRGWRRRTARRLARRRRRTAVRPPSPGGY